MKIHCRSDDASELSFNFLTSSKKNVRKIDDQSLEIVTDKNETEELFLIGSYDVWCYGIIQVIGGIYCTWNINLTVGFGSYLIGVFIMGMAYIILIVDIAEIGSAYGNFTGGIHGIVRVVLGFYPGFIVGYLQLLEFIVYASSAILYIGSVVCTTANINENFQPLIWFIVYFVTLLFTIRANRVTWFLIDTLAIFTVIVVIIYCLGSLGWVNLSKYGKLDDDYQPAHGLWFYGGFEGFISCLSFATYGFGGIESLTLMLPHMKEPQKNFQYGAISAIVTLFVCNIFLLIVMSALPPGLYVTSQELYPMNVGLDLIFHWPSVISTLLVLPPSFGLSFACFIPYGRLLQCLANSCLAPKFLGLNDKKDITRSICICSFIGYLLCILGLFQPTVSVTLSNIAIFGGFLSYFGILLSHIKLLTTFNDVPRLFKSPFGLIGSFFAIIVFLLGTVCSIGYLNDKYVTAISTISFIIFMTIYYFGYIKKRQKLSKEELKVHVVNSNFNRSRKLRRNVLYMNTMRIPLNSPNESPPSSPTKLLSPFGGSSKVNDES